MILQIFSVKDTKAAAFAPPFFLPRAEVALRTFGDALRDPNHPMHQHPTDYDLYVLGEYDDQSGKITADDEPRLIANGAKETSNGKR